MTPTLPTTAPKPGPYQFSPSPPTPSQTTRRSASTVPTLTKTLASTCYVRPSVMEIKASSMCGGKAGIVLGLFGGVRRGRGMMGDVGSWKVGIRAILIRRRGRGRRSVCLGVGLIGRGRRAWCWIDGVSKWLVKERVAVRGTVYILRVR
jgi:hypothetical protein